MTNPNLNTEGKLTWSSPLDFSGIRFRPRTETKGVTVHCSATPPELDWGAVEVDRMHRRMSWLAIGYHFIIKRDGSIETGRPLISKAAHCRTGGRNDTHVGVCLIGGVSADPVKHVVGSPWNGSDAEANFTKAQMKSLTNLLSFLKETYGLSDAHIEGHRDVKGVRKACPSFNVDKWLETGVVSLD